MIGIYVRHIIGLQPSTSKSFVDYHAVNVQKVLEDPFNKCFIFDFYAEERGHIGQAVIS